MGFCPLGISTKCWEREAEKKNRQRNPLTQLPLQKHRVGRQEHKGRMGTERPCVSLCVAVWSGV